MKITKKLYAKMETARELALRRAKLVNEVEYELEEKGVDIERLRNEEGSDLYVDMVDYGTAPISKEVFEELLDKVIENSEKK